LFGLYVLTGASSILFSFPLPIGAVWFAYFVVSMMSLNRYSEGFGRIQALGLQLEALIPLFSRLERWDTRARERFAPSLAASPLTVKLKSLNRQAGFLSIQTHPLVNVLINGVIPWNYFFLARAEVIRRGLSDRWNQTTRELHELEVLGSLAVLHRFQSRVFPLVTDEVVFQVIGLRHPLIRRERNVANDFELEKGKRLILITGSNMSGKSTFLRTVGVNQTLALMGAPVFADKMTTFRLPVGSCIRVSDSVRDGVSYFYAETLRLKDILKDAQSGSLYLIDEMFRGTNNRERLIGSQAIVGALLKTSSIGFISTHDLELTLLEEKHSQLQNWHFRDDIDESGIRFSYKIHPGPCPTTNALKIMNSLGLPVSPN
jgi:hypothetical protein